LPCRVPLSVCRPLERVPRQRHCVTGSKCKSRVSLFGRRYYGWHLFVNYFLHMCSSKVILTGVTAGTFQDRLVSALRLAKAKTIEQAQALLDRYRPEHNRKFSRPAQAKPVWRKASAQQIEQALCFKDKRTVANDNTVAFDGIIFQIPKNSPPRSYAHKRIDVHVALDGSVKFFYTQQEIAAFDSKTTHAFGLYRTHRKREGFRYGPISNLSTHNRQLSPWHFLVAVNLTLWRCYKQPIRAACFVLSARKLKKPVAQNFPSVERTAPCRFM